MLLGIEATFAEQDYHRRRATRHGYWLNGAGTVAGLRVSLQSKDPGNDTENVRVRLVVSPGIGVDGLGRELSVAEPHCVDLALGSPPARGARALERADPRRLRQQTTTCCGWRSRCANRDCARRFAAGARNRAQRGHRSGAAEPRRRLRAVRARRRAPRRRSAEEHLFAAHARIRPYDEIEDKLSANAPSVEAATGRRAQLELGACLLHSLGDDNRAPGRTPAFLTDSAALARTCSRIVIRLAPPAPDPDLIVNPRRSRSTTSCAPSFNAVALARLIRA